MTVFSKILRFCPTLFALTVLLGSSGKFAYSEEMPNPSGPGDHFLESKDIRAGWYKVTKAYEDRLIYLNEQGQPRVVKRASLTKCLAMSDLQKQSDEKLAQLDMSDATKVQAFLNWMDENKVQSGLDDFSKQMLMKLPSTLDSSAIVAEWMASKKLQTQSVKICLALAPYIFKSTNGKSLTKVLALIAKTGQPEISEFWGLGAKGEMTQTYRDIWKVYLEKKQSLEKQVEDSQTLLNQMPEGITKVECNKCGGTGQIRKSRAEYDREMEEFTQRMMSMPSGNYTGGPSPTKPCPDCVKGVKTIEDQKILAQREKLSWRIASIKAGMETLKKSLVEIQIPEK